MEEQIREHYFMAVRISLVLILELYIVVSEPVLIWASGRTFLLLSLFVGAMAGKGLASEKKKWLFFCMAVLIWILLMSVLGKVFLMLGILLCYEGISELRPDVYWYGVPFAMACVPSGIGIGTQLVLTFLMSLIYLQHDCIVESYRKQAGEDILQEQRLKHSLYEKEYEIQRERKRSLLASENRILEELTRIAQTLHDRLGHNINGSVYQLEAVKVLLEREPETSKRMLQAVIDQLRTGMDEIRAILRKEHPGKDKLTILHLEKLCEECRQKGVDAGLFTEGNLSEVSEACLEILLDNAYEAVSNSLKYAECTRIEIRIHVMNRMIRCSISDNGKGCEKIVDGMGISGMRRRIREVNGILDFETAAGFTINMLLPRKG
ncbi:MAG: hypothetical protein IJ801_00905 [Lachnospiraceae bacterium]|nr:hypothetical protein [Lachnospiraceae bacterium]